MNTNLYNVRYKTQATGACNNSSFQNISKTWEHLSSYRTERRVFLAGVYPAAGAMRAE